MDINPDCKAFEEWLRLGMNRHGENIGASRDCRGTGMRCKELEAQLKSLAAELVRINDQLYQKAGRRRTAEESLEKFDTALDVLMGKREKDRHKIEENIQSNMKELIFPYTEMLRKSGLNNGQKDILVILESNLNQIVSSFSRELSSEHLNFTPMETKVADLVRQGKTNKEIAELLCLSIHTILTHRHNIRVKLGLKNKKVNLREYLISFGQY